MRIAVIGGGATAVAAMRIIARHPMIIGPEFVVFSKKPLASSIAFSQEGPSCLLANTSDEITSLAALDYRFGIGNTEKLDCADPSVMLPRKHYGYQIADAADELRSRKSRVTEILEPAGLVLQEPEGCAVVAGGQQWVGFDVVLLCRGLADPVVPKALSSAVSLPNVFASPYTAEPQGRLWHASRGKVAVVGSGLSAVETAVNLTQVGTATLLISRSGTLPAVRNATPANDAASSEVLRSVAIDSRPLDHEEGLKRVWNVLMRGCVGRYVGLAALGTFDRLEAELGLAKAGESSWEAMVVPLIEALMTDATNPTRTNWSEVLRGSTIERYFGALHVGLADRLGRAFESGQLEWMPLADVRRAEPTGSGELRLTTSHDRDVLVSSVVCAAGWHTPSWGRPRRGVTDLTVKDNTTLVNRSSYAVDNGLSAPSVIAIGVEAASAAPMPNALDAVYAQVTRLADGLALMATSKDEPGRTISLGRKQPIRGFAQSTHC